MMAPRLVVDGWTLYKSEPGVKSQWYCIQDGKLITKTTNYVEDVVRENKEHYNEDTPIGEGAAAVRVASIPLNVYYAEVQPYERDPGYVKKWLNDPDNRAWRTHKVKI